MKSKSVRRGKIIKIVISTLFWLVAAALVITNFFIPVKYLSAFAVLGNGGIASDTMRVRFLAVDGGCSLIEFPDGKSMLVDGGDGGYSSQLKTFKNLNKSGIKQLDYVVSTTARKERSGGLKEIIKYKGAKNAFLPFIPQFAETKEYSAFCSELAACTVDISEPFANYVYYNEDYGYYFAVFSPFESVKQNVYTKSLTEEEIDYLSTVVYAEYSDTGILFLSDSSMRAQQEIVNALNAGLYSAGGREINIKNCKIIQVAKHGAESGVCAPLYDLIKPQTAIIPVYGGQPSVSAVMTAEAYARVYRTDEYGDITVTVSADGYKLN